MLILLVAAALPGPVFFALSALQGHLLLSPDSVNYIAAARALARGGNFASATGGPFVYWPPLLPLVLFGGGLTGLSESAVGLLTNCLAWVALAAITGLWTAELTQRWSIGLAAALAVSISSPLYYVSEYLWSEPLFSLLAMTSLFLLWKFTAEGAVRLLFLSALFGALAALTRYAGLFVVIGEAGALLFVQRQEPARRAFLSLSFMGCALLPLGCWLVRNDVEAGTITGQRYPSAHGVRDVLDMLTAGIGTWWLPWRTPDGIREALGSLVLLALAAAVAWAAAGFGTSRYRAALLLLGGSSLAYFAAMASSAAVSNTCCFGGRFEAPYFAPVMTAIALIVYRVGCRWRRVIRSGISRSRLAAAGAAMVFLPSVMLSAARMKDYAAMARDGDDFGASLWSKSEAIRFLHGVPPDFGVFTNFPHPVFLYSNRYVQQTPSNGAYESSVHLDTTPQFQQQLAAHRENLLIWFNRATMPPYLFGWPELSSRFDLSLVQHFPDADIYRIGSQ